MITNKKIEEKKEYWKKYRLDYYHKYKTYKVECEYCKSVVAKDTMRRHIKTNKCNRLREQNNNNNNVDKNNENL